MAGLKLSTSGISLSTKNSAISRIWLHGEGLEELQSVRIWNKKPINAAGTAVADRVLYWRGTIAKVNAEGTRALARVKVNTPPITLIAEAGDEKIDRALVSEFLTVHITVTIDEITEPVNNQINQQEVIIDGPEI